MFPGSKGGRCVELTTLPPSGADCLEIWDPQPPGILRACRVCNRIALPFTVFTSLQLHCFTLFLVTTVSILFPQSRLNILPWRWQQNIPPKPLDVYPPKHTASHAKKTVFKHLNDWLTVHRSITLVDLQLDAQNSYLFTYNTFIKILYMFQALSCSSSGGLRRNRIYAASGIVTVCKKWVV
jgi:hypothetical protein